MSSDKLAVLAVQAHEQALRAVGVDVAGRGVGGDVGPAEPGRDDVGVEDGELVLPDHLAGFFIQAHDALLDRFGDVGAVFVLLAVVIDEVDAAIENERRGAAAVGGGPEDVALDLVGEVGVG